MNNLLNDFYLMNKNRTTGSPTGDDIEGMLFFVANVTSNSYRDAFSGCFNFTIQVYAHAKADWVGFPNMEERGLGFLFNFLEKSFTVRIESENMIIYANKSDWVNYGRSLGKLVQDIIYFKYEVGGSYDTDYPLLYESPVVTQTRPEDYEFNIDTTLQALFGFFDGAINALPKGSLISNCGAILRD